MEKEVSKIDGQMLVQSAIASLQRCVDIVGKLSKKEDANGPLSAELANCSLKQENSAAEEDKREKIIVIEPYQDETQMPEIMRMIACELSEPYSIYTYRYFIHNWPGLTFLAPMLAVDVSFRRMGIGTRLVEAVIQVMNSFGCDEIILETEVTNTNAMNLYSRLGFIREKRLFRYYLNGVDAFRLKLFFTIRDPNQQMAMDSPASMEVDYKTEENEENLFVDNKISC
uniref:N-acetyltransferase domain-containing protein n=1 Tax=Ditylenchus dipsaci TaxID=166011 RepID=A0A915EF64_9BILA